MTIEELKSRLQALAAAMTAKGYPYAQAVVCIGSAGYPDGVLLGYLGAEKGWPTINCTAYHAQGVSLAAKLADAAVWVATAPTVTDPAEVA